MQKVSCARDSLAFRHRAQMVRVDLLPEHAMRIIHGGVRSGARERLGKSDRCTSMQYTHGLTTAFIDGHRAAQEVRPNFGEDDTESFDHRTFSV